MNTWWRSKQKNKTKIYNLNKFAQYFGLKTNPEEGLFIVLIQFYNWEIRHHSTVCRCGLVDYEHSLFLLSPSSKTPATRKKWPRAWLKARRERRAVSLFSFFLFFFSGCHPRFSRLSRGFAALRSRARALPLLKVDLLIFYILDTIMFVCYWQEMRFIW